MITKVKTSVSISSALIHELASYNEDGNVSEFMEKALVFYLHELKKQRRVQRDMEIIEANADRFNREAEENLQFQSQV